MNTRSFLPGLGAALLVGAIAACSDSTSPNSASTSVFEAQASDDIAPNAGEDVGSDYTFYSNMSDSTTGIGSTLSRNTSVGMSRDVLTHGPLSASAGVTADRIRWISSLCGYDEATGAFDCPAFTKSGPRGTNTYNISYTLFDANGLSQSAYSDSTTASIHFVVSDTSEVAYTWNSNSFADTSGHHRNATVSNLLGRRDTLHIWNSIGVGSILSVRTGQIAKVYQLASSDTTSNVDFRQPRGINPYPLSGQIIRNYTVVRTREASDTTTRTTTRRVVVTFNGTANVPMTVGSTQYMLNLDTHVVTKE